MDTPNPYILAIESSTDIASVALFGATELLGELEYRVPRSHARLLLPMIQDVLKNLKVELSQLDAVAVSKGPGSYTGLRVGVSTAKGLAMAKDLALLSYDSLMALAVQAQTLAQQIGAQIVPMIDARRMEVYTAVFDEQMNVKAPIHAKIIDENAFEDILSQRKVIFVGNGVKKCIPVLEAQKNAIFLPDILSSTSYMGPHLFEKFQSKSFEDLGQFEPYYLKDFVATKPKKLF